MYIATVERLHRSASSRKSIARNPRTRIPVYRGMAEQTVAREGWREWFPKYVEEYSARLGICTLDIPTKILLRIDLKY